MDMRKLQIPAADGFPLDAVWIEAKGCRRGIVQFHRGTSTQKEHFMPFAEFLAEHGYAVLLFDYRGMGGSRPASLKGFKGRFTDWGRLDMVGALDWLQERYPEDRKYIVAHSMGGQLIGLMKNHHLVDGIVTIGSSYGTWRHYSGANKAKSAIIWATYAPVATALFGYLPLAFAGFGEDLPRGNAIELWTWCLRTGPYSKILEDNNIPHYYNEVVQPFKAFFMEDDNVTTLNTIPSYKKDYKNAALDVEIIRPHDLGAKKLGHYGFFKPRYKDQLWTKVIGSLDGFRQCRVKAVASRHVNRSGQINPPSHHREAFDSMTT